jgi:hypothetical protein
LVEENGEMSRFCDYVLVLWGERFEEAPAAIFITVLREAGLRVKVVGLTPRQICGAHGLALVPDVTLDQALTLAAHTICVVIPATPPDFRRLETDPRVVELLQQGHANRAKFVLGPLFEVEIGERSPLSLPEGQVLVYPDCEDLLPFARDLARSLVAAQPDPVWRC